MAKDITFVDKNDNVIGVGDISEAVAKGIVHRVSRIFVVNPQGDMLLQKRSSNSMAFPNRWEQAASGHVDEGETYEQTAYRELKEEVGVENIELKEIAKVFFNEPQENGTIKKSFNTIYVGTYSGEAKPDNEEVSEVRWVAPGDLAQWMEQRPDDFTPGFFMAYREFLKVR